MLKIFYILLVVLFAFTLSKSLKKKKTKCAHEGVSCYHLQPCCTGLTCYNNKCEKRYSSKDRSRFLGSK